MATNVEWVVNPDGTKGESWNPATGCTKLSAGCLNCYAERIAADMAGRFGSPADDPFRVTLHPNRLEQPLHWRKPRSVFVCSMSDLFHEDIPEDYLRRVFGVMREGQQHTYQVLTKRADRMAALASRLDWPENVWAGVTVENADSLHRLDALRTVPAPVRFLSCEPLLGALGELDLRGIGWVIAGGESGPNARPMQESWATALRDQCTAEGVPFFFKQWGGKHKSDVLQGRTWHQVPCLSPKELELGV